MPSRARRDVLYRRLIVWLAGWIFAAAVYLLLIDITDLPELIVGVAAAVLAATGFELAREQHVLGGSVSLSWLNGAFRALASAPRDIVLVGAAAIRQLARREQACGEFRSANFVTPSNAQLAIGQRALAESLGSFAPNTIVIGIDPDRELILGHQLRPRGGRRAIDVLGLG
jgi:hypothetical protein